MVMIKAHFFDGITSEAKDVSILTESKRLLILDGPQQIIWNIEDVRVIHFNPTRDLTLGLKNSRASLVVEHEAVGVLKDAYPQLVKSPIVVRKRYLFILSVLVLIVFLGFHYSVPLIAKFLPYSWEKSLGSLVELSIVRQHKVCKTDSKVLQKLGARLKEEGNIPFDVSFDIIKDPEMENAFAIPGGKIYIFTGLLKAAQSQEEVIGILAHELGHVYHHHNTQGLIYALGFSAFMSALTGGTSDVISVQVVQYLILMKNSRANEREADAYAMDLLGKLQVSPKGMADFFSRHKHNNTIELISTHPISEERVAFFAQQLKGKANRKLLSEKEFDELRTICQ